MEEDRFEVIDQDAYEAVNAKEKNKNNFFLMMPVFIM